MQQFQSLELTLFENPIAAFKVGVSVVTQKRRMDNSMSNTSYISRTGYANVNPDIYLTFTYLTDDFKTNVRLAMSYPQVYSLRRQMARIEDFVLTEENYGFDDHKGLHFTVEVPTDIGVGGIGRDGHSVQFIPAITEDENGLQVKTVHIKLSASEYASVLSLDEFLTVYEIINDLDLANIQLQVGLWSLASQDTGGNTSSGYSNDGGYNQQQRPQGSGRSFATRAAAGRDFQPSSPAPRRQATQNTTNLGAPTKTVETTPVQSTPTSVRGRSEQTSSTGRRNLLDEVKEVPVSQISFNDDLEDEFDTFFDEENRE